MPSAEETRRAEAAARRAERAEKKAEQAERDAERAEDGAEGAEGGAKKAASGAKKAASGAKKAASGAARSAARAEKAESATEEAAARSADVAAEAAAAVVASDDPLLDTAIREIAAQASEEQPYGVPGPPTSRSSPFRLGFLGGLGLLTAYLVGLSLVAVRSVLVLLLISGFLAVGLNPLVELFERRGISRGRAVGVVLVLVLLGFTGFLFAIVPPIIDQTTAFVDKAPSLLDQLRDNSTVRSLDNRFHVLTQAKSAVSSPDLATNVFGGVLGVGKVVFSAIFSAVTVLTLTLYFMSSLPAMKDAAYKALPRSRRARVGLLTDDILGRVGGYVAGAITIALCAGGTSFVLLLILGVPYPLALALVVLVTDLLPVIGATIGAVIVSAVAFTHDVRAGVIIAVYYLLYQQFENYVLYPRIMKRSVDVSPAVTIVAVLLGASLLGVVGALLAIPIAAAVQLVLVEVVLPRQETA